MAHLNLNKNHKSNYKPFSPISPISQQIISNPSALNYNNALSPSVNFPMDLLTDSNTNDVCPITFDVGSSPLGDNQPSITDLIIATDNQRNYNDVNNSLLRLFSSNYTGPVIILTRCSRIDLEKNLGN